VKRDRPRSGKRSSTGELPQSRPKKVLSAARYALFSCLQGLGLGGLPTDVRVSTGKSPSWWAFWCHPVHARQISLRAWACRPIRTIDGPQDPPRWDESPACFLFFPLPAGVCFFNMVVAQHLSRGLADLSAHREYLCGIIPARSSRSASCQQTVAWPATAGGGLERLPFEPKVRVPGCGEGPIPESLPLKSPSPCRICACSRPVRTGPGPASRRESKPFPRARELRALWMEMDSSLNARPAPPSALRL